MRIIFMGTPDFAVASLKALINEHKDVVAVVTAPDRPAGRGKQLRSSAVKQYADSMNIRVLQPEKLKNPEFIEELKSLKPDIMVVVAFRMLPKVVWSIPKCGTFNLHASLLPQYRGAAPINWALINGERKTGVTTFFIDEKIDTGAVILQESCEISNDMNAGELHDILMAQGADLVVETVNRIEHQEVEIVAQADIHLGTHIKEAPKLSKQTSKIDWSESAKSIVNLIRGLSPYPSSWSILKNGDKSLNVKIFKAVSSNKEVIQAIGHILQEGSSLFVTTGDGVIEILELQLEGKKRLPVVEVLKGFKLIQGAYFE